METNHGKPDERPNDRPGDQPKGRLRPGSFYNVYVLGLTSLLTDISSEMVYPLIPLFLVAKLGAGPAIVGVIEGIAESLASLLKVFSGHLSDRTGRRKPLAIGGYVGSTIGKVFLYAAGSWPLVLVSRVIDRFGKGVRTAPRDAMIADTIRPEQRGRAFGLHRLLDTTGATIGSLLGFWFLTRYKGDFRPVFLWSLVPAFIGVIALSLAREPGVQRSLAKDLSFKWSALDRRLKAFLIIASVFTLGNSSNQFLLLRAGNVGFSAETVILLYVAYNLTYALVSYPAGRLSDRIGRKALLVAGYTFYGLVYIGFAVVKHLPFYWGLFILYGVYIGLSEGVEKAFVTDIAPGNLRATMIGLHATLVGIALLPASLLAGLMWSAFGPVAPFYFGGVMGLLAAVALAVLI
ncbi:MAG TPA: MFS transporter [Bacillota bacterium]|jgi:MFS family permease